MNFRLIKPKKLYRAFTTLTHGSMPERWAQILRLKESMGREFNKTRGYPQRWIELVIWEHTNEATT